MNAGPPSERGWNTQPGVEPESFCSETLFETKKKKKNYIVNANKCFINFLTVISIKFSNSLRDARKLTSLAACV